MQIIQSCFGPVGGWGALGGARHPMLNTIATYNLSFATSHGPLRHSPSFCQPRLENYGKPLMQIKNGSLLFIPVLQKKSSI